MSSFFNFNTLSCFLAEFIGTALLVFFACMGCIRMESIQTTYLQMNLQFGLVVMIIIQTFGCVSGAHINPSVTVAACILKLVSIPMALIYIVAQTIGAILGYGLLKILIIDGNIHKKDESSKGLCVTVPNSDVTVIQAMAIEYGITMMLILVCCGIWNPKNSINTDSIPIKIGLTIACLCCVAGGSTGASMNPARSLGPAVWNVEFEAHWVYWVGPLLAGVITPLIYKFFFWVDHDIIVDESARKPNA